MSETKLLECHNCIGMFESKWIEKAKEGLVCKGCIDLYDFVFCHECKKYYYGGLAGEEVAELDDGTCICKECFLSKPITEIIKLDSTLGSIAFGHVYELIRKVFELYLKGNFKELVDKILLKIEEHTSYKITIRKNDDFDPDIFNYLHDSHFVEEVETLDDEGAFEVCKKVIIIYLKEFHTSKFGFDDDDETFVGFKNEFEDALNILRISIVLEDTEKIREDVHKNVHPIFWDVVLERRRKEEKEKSGE